MSPAPATPPGTLLQFLRELRATGAPVLRLPGHTRPMPLLARLEAEAAADPHLTSLLRFQHREAAEDVGGPPLPFDEPAARLGATLLFRAAWLYLHRDSTADDVTRLLTAAVPAFPNAAAQFSADLALQHLPALFRMAQALAPGDPLLAALRQLAAHVPLSAVGLPPEENSPPSADPAAWAALQEHPGLHQLFLDRIVLRQAREWLVFPNVSTALQDSLGACVRELAPFILITK